MINRTGFSNRLSAPWGASGHSVGVIGAPTRLQAACNATIGRIFGHRLAINHATAEEIAFGTAINVAPIDDSKDDWVMISPYGEFPNDLGLQVFNQERADKIVTAFNSVLGKLGRMFRGVPIYRGHPYQRPDLWPDDSRYGRVDALEARTDGLYGKIAWNDLGLKNKEQGYFVYPSPGWHFDNLGNGRIAPKNLDHIGLTNSPNITSVQPLTNSRISAAPAESEQPTTKGTIMEKTKLIAALGLKADATDEEIVTAINSLKSEKDIATNAEKNPLILAINGKLVTATEEAKKNLGLAINARLDAAVDKGVISAAERTALATKFAADYDGLDKELKDKQPALNTKSLNLSPSGKDLSDASQRRIAFNSRVDELFAGGCKSMNEVITRMKANKEDAALLDAMNKGEEPKAA